MTIMMRKWIKRIFYSILIFSTLLGLAFYAFYTRFVIEAPTKNYTKPVSVKEAQLQDLDYLSLYVDYDKSFDTSEKQKAFFNEISQIKTALPLEKCQFIMRVAKAVAQANNTHTNINPIRIAKQVNALPIRFYWFKDGLRVILTQAPYQDLLGVKIIAINGHNPNSLLEDIKLWYGGSKNRLRFFSPLYLMSPEILDAIGFGHTKETIELIYEKDIGIHEKIVLHAKKENQLDLGYWPPNWLNTNLIEQKKNWYGLNTGIFNAIPYQYTQNPVSHSFLGKGLYVQLNENINSKDINTNEYLSNVLDQAKNEVLEFVILDLRFNPGGDYSIGRSFIKKINKLLKNKPFYIVTGNGTFSAGIMTAAIAKNEAQSNAMIVGEPIGDTMQFWADGGSVMRLPNSKITLRIWTAYHDWKNGCKDWSKCFWITIFDGVKVNHLNLDKVIPLEYSDYINGEDSVLKFILSKT